MLGVWGEDPFLRKMLKSCAKRGVLLSLPEGSEQLQDVFHRRISLQLEGLD